jgi:hypothetical protein
MAEMAREFESVPVTPSALERIAVEAETRGAAPLASHAPLSEEQREKLETRAVILRLIDYFSQ